MALLGDLGGIIESFMLSLGFIFFTYSEFLFQYMSVKRVFLARTAKDNLF